MNQDQEHLRLLSIFHYVVAGFAALFACFPIMYLFAGLVVLLQLPPFVTQNQPHPGRLIGLVFVVMGGTLVLLGWAFAACVAYAGRCLGQRKRYKFCVVMGGVACMFMPFGTILGVFSIIVLVRPSVKALFDGATPPAFAT